MPCTLPASLADAAVCRGSFHAVLGGEAGEAVFADFSAALQKAQAEGRILTASLFRYENHLFFYAEGLNRPFTPQGLCPALDAALLPWPPALGEAAAPPMGRHAAVFFTTIPTTAADWQQGAAARSAAAGALRCCRPTAGAAIWSITCALSPRGWSRGTAGISSVCRRGVLFLLP